MRYFKKKNSKIFFRAPRKCLSGPRCDSRRSCL